MTAVHEASVARPVPSDPVARRAWEVAATVTDPEVPVLTIEDLGVLRSVDKTPYDTLVAQQNAEVTAKRGVGDLKKLLHSGMTWQVK